MVVGFNHNIRYKGELFHVQTEDSGLANPHIITLLYLGGTILSSQKTSYADIIKTDQLEQVVESIMKDQHRDMMRRLKGGEFDARLFPGAPPIAAQETGPQETAPREPVSRELAPHDLASQELASLEIPAPPPTKRSLDEVILDYLITGEEK